MKKALTFLIGLIAGIIAASIFYVAWLNNNLFTVYESDKDFDQTVEAITNSVENNDWTISHQYNLQATMKKHNLESEPVIVMSLCNPAYGYKVLTDEESREATSILPCRVAIYEKDGETYVSMLNAELLSKFMSRNVNKTLVSASKENKEIIESVIYN